MSEPVNSVHQPRNFDPEAYEFVEAWDSQPEPGSYIGDGGEWEFEGRMVRGTNPLNAQANWLKGLLRESPTSAFDKGDRGYQCDHCGAHLRYVCVLRHTSGDHIAVGETCLDNRVGSMDKATWRVKELREAAKRAREAAKTRDAKADNLEILPWLSEVLEYEGWLPPVLWDLKRQHQNGTWLKYQMDGIWEVLWKKAWDEFKAENARRAAQRAEWEAKKSPAPEGKVTVEGEVIKTAWHENDFGGALKMTVKDARGFVVWITAPRSILNVLDARRNAVAYGDVEPEPGETFELVGKRVRFTATLTRSDRDESFAFGKRPTKAEILEGATA